MGITYCDYCEELIEKLREEGKTEEDIQVEIIKNLLEDAYGL